MADQDIQSNVVLTADTSQYNQAITASAAQTDAMGHSVDSLGSKINSLTKVAGRKLLGITAADTAVITGTTLAYAAWEKQMTSLNVQAAVLSKTMGNQKALFNGYASQVNGLRREFAQSTSEAAQLVQTISKMSDNSTSVTNLERSFGKLGASMQESSAGLAASMLQLQRTMGTSQRDTGAFNNQLVTLQSRSNAAASSILGFANSIAPVARMANISQTDIMGMSNAFIKAGQDGYQASNVITRMLTDITQATVSGSPELAKYANLVGMTVSQFKNLGGTGQITQIFDAINRQGPQAITTLNRMGYDGLRTVRTISAMAQQGGLQGEIDAARNADPNALNRGSAAAMNGILDSMKKMRIELTQTAEDFGSVFAKPAKMFFDSMTMIAKGIHAVVDSPLGKVVAVVAAAAAPFAALAGALLLAAKGLTAFAAANQIFRGSVMTGFRETRSMTAEQIMMARAQGMRPGGVTVPGSMAPRIPGGPQGAAIAERGAWTSRMLYNSGANFAQVLPSGVNGANIFSRAAGTTAAGMSGLTRIITRAALAPGAVYMPGVRDSGGYNDVTRRWNVASNQISPYARMRSWMSGTTGPDGTGAVTGTAMQNAQLSLAQRAASLRMMVGGVGTNIANNWRLAGSLTEGGMSNFRAGFTAPWAAGAGVVPTGSAPPPDSMGAGGSAQARTMERARLAEAYNTQNGLLNRSTGALSNFEKVTRTAGQGMGMLTRTMSQSMMMLGGTAAGALRTGGGLIGRGFNAIGMNPYMGGIMAAGVGLMFAGKMNKATTQVDMTNTSNFGQSYFQAGGISAPPTANVTYAHQRPVASTIGSALTVSGQDVAYAQSSAHKLTNSALRGLSKDEVLARLSPQWSTIRQSPEAVNATKLDLIDKFGPTVASQMLAQLDRGGAPGLSSLAGKAAQGGAFLGIWGSNKSSAKAMDQFFGGANDLTDTTFGTSGPQAAAQARGRTLIEGYAQFAAGNVKGPQKNAFEKEFNKNVLGLANVNYMGADGFLGGLGDYGGTKLEAGRSSTLQGFLTDMSEHGALSNAHNRKDVAERFGIDNYKKMDDKQFATALYNVIKNGPDYKKWEQTQETTQDLLKASSAALFGVAGVMGNRTIQNALQNTGDVNAQYAAANEIQRRIAAGGGGTRKQFGAIESLISAAGADDSQGASLFRGAYAQMSREQGFRQPYMTRTQSFGAQTGQFQAAMAAPISAGWTAQDRQGAQDQFAGQVQEQYNYFKQMLYQQREYEVSRSRAETDFNLQRRYALMDFALQRSRAEADFQLQRSRAEDDYGLQVRRSRYQFNLQRSREEQDHQHQVMLMVEQQAKAMYNMYERVKVQQTNSASWLLVNSQDQLARMQKQSQQLDQLRKMGLGDDAIQQLGLTDSANAQQLSRFVGEVSADPSMIKAFNDAVKKRLGAARDLVTDESSTDWQEFQRSYNLARNRASDDFELSMKQSHADFKKSLSRQDTDFQTSLHRQQHDFATSMDRQQKAYSLSMSRAADDLARSAQTIDGNFEQILTQAVKKLGGHAAKQAKAVLGEFEDLKGSTADASVDIMTTIAAIFGLDWTPPKAKAITAQATKNQNALAEIHGFASGGVLPGYTPGRDVHHFTSPTAGALALSGGEAVMVPEWTRAVGGPKAVEAMNKSARYGQGYASGGVIPQARLNEAKTFAKAQVGDPYVWGGVGPSGYDCSGFMSALTNVLMGNNPYHRYGATASFPWAGFKSGPGQFTIGSTKHYPGSSVGHMAGTLDGMNVESRGGRGVIVGPSARGYRDPGFTTVAHLGTGGDFGYSGGADTGSIPTLRSIIKNYYPNAERSAAGLMPHFLAGGDISHVINAAARAKYRKLKAKGLIGSPDSAAGSMPINPGDPTSPEADVRIAAAHYGWMPQQWRALSNIIQHESGFNPTAQNPTSTAYGMFQFLDSTWASVGGHKTSDPMLQAQYGTKYIKNRYGNPNKAWDFWQQHHWYGDGAVFSGAQTIGVGERGPEAVIPLNDRGADFMSTLMSKYGSGLEGRGVNVRGSQPIYVSNNNTYHVDKSTTFTGPISVQADNPGQLIAALQQRQRVMALANPAMGGVKV